MRISGFFPLLPVAAGISAALAFSGLNVAAATKIWDGGGTNTFWTNPSNWVDNVTPSAGDNLIFPDTFRVANINDFPDGTIFNSVVVSGYNYTFAGNSIALVNGITNGPHSVTFRLPIRLEGNQSFNVVTGLVTMAFQGSVIDLNGHELTLAGAATYTVSSAIHGPGSLVCTRSTELSGTNTYTGTTRVLSGGLVASHNRTLGDSVAPTEVASGATLVLRGGLPFDESFRLAGGSRLAVEPLSAVLNGPIVLEGPNVGFAPNWPIIVDSVITGPGGITLNSFDSALLTLNADNTYTGSNTIGRGNFIINGQQPSSEVFLDRGTLSGVGRVGRVTSIAGRVRPGTNGPGILTSADIRFGEQTLFVAELNGISIGTGYDQLNVMGAVSLGNAFLGISNSFAAGGGEQFTIINNDATDAVIGAFAGLQEGEILLAGGIRFRISYTGGDGNDVVLTALPPPPGPTGVSRIWDGEGGNNLWSTPQNWAGNVAPQEGDDLQFPGGASQLIVVNDFPGGTTFNSLRFTGGGYRLEGAPLALTAGIAATHNSGANELAAPVHLNTNQTFSSAAAVLSVSAPIYNAGSTLTISGAGEVLLAGSIWGAGGITKLDTGNLSLLSSNSYLGATEVASGQLTVSNALVFGSTKFGTFVRSNATLVLYTDITAEPLTLLGKIRSMGESLSSTNTITGPISLSNGRVVELQVSNVLVLAGAHAGDGGFNKSGSGTLVLAGTGSDSFGTAVSSGRVFVSGSYDRSGIYIFNGIAGGTGRLGALRSAQSGGATNQVIAPGLDAPGILTVYRFSMDRFFFAGLPAKLRMQLNGPQPGIGYDQLRIEETVYVNLGQLEISLGFVPAVGDRFVIIDNIPWVVVYGRFLGLPEGAVFQVGETQFQISYWGGDGNDVELTVVEGLPARHIWYGGGTNNYWSTPQNWIGHVVPSPGKALVFPDLALRTRNTNDLASGTEFNSVIVDGLNYLLYGAPLTLRSGIVANASSTIGFQINLPQSATFLCQTSTLSTNPVLELRGPIICADNELTLSGSGTSRIFDQIKFGSLLKAGSGAAELRTNNFIDRTRVLEGTLAIFHNDALGSDAIAAEVLNSGLLTLGSRNLDVAKPLLLSGTLGLSGGGTSRWSGDITLSNQGSFSSSNGLFVVTGTISGSADLVASGGASLSLMADNTYTGATIISNGLLFINGSQPQSPVLIRSGASLWGRGSAGVIYGTNSNSSINPGGFDVDTAILSCRGLALFSNAQLSFTALGTIAGTEHDQLRVAGTVALNRSRFTPTIFSAQVGDRFVLIDNDETDPVVDTFRGLPEGAFFVQSNKLFQISYVGGDGNDVTLTRLAAPPSTLTPILAPYTNAMIIRGTGVSNLIYTLQAASNLHAPVLWETIGIKSANNLNIYEFIHTNTPFLPMRFYRVVSP
jgi:autotransporter-associated beta strand protein